MTDAPTAYGLVFSFEDQMPSYAYGFEAGMIWALMESGVDEIDRVTHSENTATLIRMAAAGGYSIDVAGTDTLGWVRAVFVRRPQPRAALHLVAVEPADG